MAYVRGDEGPASVFYGVKARYYEQLPPGIKRIVEAVERATDLPRRGVSTWPIDDRAVASAARAFVQAANNVYFADLDIENPDPAPIDAFVREHLVDRALRKTIDDPGAYAAILEAESQQVPNEPLLYYALGCYLGEWMVRHCGARWFLFAPLDPIQSFPDLLRTVTLTTLAPFSMATKMIADPVGSAFASVVAAVPDAALFGPVALCASASDAEEVLRGLMGESIPKAVKMLRSGKQKAAFDLLEKEVEKNRENGHLLHQVAVLGWDYHEYGLVHRASELQRDLAPGSTETQHNFAAIESMREGGLDHAIEILEGLLERDPDYTRTRLTLASCYQEAGQPLKAAAMAKWLVDNAPDYAEPASELLKELQ